MFAIYRNSAGNSGDIVWLDAVLNKSESYTGSLTKHPVEGGSRISDHSILEPLRLSLTGVITDYDFNSRRPILPNAYDNKTPYNDIRQDSAANVTKIISNKQNPLFNILPEQIGNLSTRDNPVIPTVEVSLVSQQKSLAIKDILKTIRNNSEDFTILGFKDGKLIDKFDFCVITSLEFPESEQTGDSVDFTLQVEQITRVYLKQGTTPKFKEVTPVISASAAGKVGIQGDKTKVTVMEDGISSVVGSDTEANHSLLSKHFGGN